LPSNCTLVLMLNVRRPLQRVCGLVDGENAFCLKVHTTKNN
jgi:hypothetical protein